MKKLIGIALFGILAACEPVPTEITVNVLNEVCIMEDSLIVVFDSLGAVLAIDTVYVGRCTRAADEVE